MLRRELNTDVDKIHGKYGEFSVLVDGEEVVETGAYAALLMSDKSIVAAVRKRLASQVT